MSDNATSGMWRSGNDLVIQPDHAQLPMRCLWTNEPVRKMTEMTLHETQVDDQGFTTTIQQSELKVSLPVNPDWLKQRAALRNRIARILLIVGGIVLLISIIAAFIINSISNGSIAVLFVGAGGGGLGGLAVIIGAAIPFLKGVGMDPTVYAGARFLDNAIIIRRVSPEFLEGLPAWDGPTN